MLVLASILLVGAVLAAVASPLVRGTTAPLSDGPDDIAELHELYALRDVNYETLRDIEFDFHSGKIDEADYRDMTDRYTAETARLIHRIDALERGVRGRGPAGA